MPHPTISTSKQNLTDFFMFAVQLACIPFTVSLHYHKSYNNGVEMQISTLKKEIGSTTHGMLPWKNESQQRTESKNLQERTNTSLSMTNNLLGLLAKELKKPVTMYRMWQSVQGQNLILQIAIHHCVQGSSWVLLFLGSAYSWQVPKKTCTCYLCRAWESSEDMLEWGEGSRLSGNSNCVGNMFKKLPSEVWSSLSAVSAQILVNAV